MGRSPTRFMRRWAKTRTMSERFDRRVVIFRFQYGALVQWQGEAAQPWRVQGRRYEERLLSTGVYYGLAQEGNLHTPLQWVAEPDLVPYQA